ncbi:MAG: ribonuclease HII [Acidimicrobiia bacterium]|nr:ribonuclease HII [Acidimicrobiia bacterium]
MESSRSQLASSRRESFACDQTFEQWAVLLGHRRIAGIDEVGRGALFGPVCAAAVTLNLEKVPAGIDDSKKLSPKQREVLAEKIRDTALDFSIAFVEARIIDDINILQATFEAMRRAVQGLRRTPDFLLCDSVILPGCAIPQRSIVKGDARSVSIAAASIIAKVERDRLLSSLDAKYPGYDLANNMGYGTEKHLKALSVLGPTDLHRRTFRGVSVDSPIPGC